MEKWYSEILWKVIPAADQKELCATNYPCDGGDPTPPEPPPTGDYVVTQNKREEKTFSTPCMLSFDIVPDRDGSADTEDVLLWVYTSGGDWAGGNPAPGTMGVRLNAYNSDLVKLKVYDVNGHISNEPKIASGWKKGVKYSVGMRVENGIVIATINGLEARLEGQYSPRVTIGYGWPPSKRQGCLGAVITNVVWTGQ